MKNNPARAGGAVRAGDWLRFARHFLEELPGERGEEFSQEAAIDTQVLLAHVLGKPRAWILAHLEVILTPLQQRALTKLLARLAKGEPLPYLTGHQEFFGLDFEVSPDVLIPRPETELLVEEALNWLRQHPERRRAADIGTGSGCIAISLAKHIPDLTVLAVDPSPEALEVAQRNAGRHAVTSQIQFCRRDLISPENGSFDLVCANLPYIPQAVLRDLPAARFEPRAALDGGPDGLQAIRALVGSAHGWLAPGSLLLLEIQYDQGEPVTALAREMLPAARIAVLPDLAGLPRLVRIEDPTA